ncbi:hypothetical protein MGYG_02124 [Nannizzia gypsea CBS 118893]|uniref:Uncharacterized protein n=1 Tax=Arthroderma gypseum (strain ATCC MYA-4604 / CBS 118893) TaxID=535722 RepID=E4UPX7_ARTGP|nr:hypothetical protein MGYG_02124 [Nannizzia gypsea CBS 118893]EFQ99111.1 hypothetical protein MGYG_02124 [Nannizzia gypsea CBS 118893]
MSPALKLPGFGIPLNQAGKWRASLGDGFVTNTEYNRSKNFRHKLFDNALDKNDIYGAYAFMPLLTTREHTMIHVMNDITDKPGWEDKVFDMNITAKWRRELLEDDTLDITEKMVDWIIDELQYKSKPYKTDGIISALASGVMKSDTLIPSSLQESLKASVARLENVPEAQKDYHPYTDNQVLDLVHPSLFPLVYGKSRIVKDGILNIHDGITKSGTGEIIPIPSMPETGAPGEGRRETHPSMGKMDRPFSDKFQWLPCDVAFRPMDDPTNASREPIDSSICTITSYINNLHPEAHKELYAVLEQIITCTIPLWNETLSRSKNWPDYRRIEYTACTYDPDPNDIPEEDRPQQLPDENEDDYWQRLEEWEWEIRKVVKPEPGKFVPEEEREAINLQRDYGKTGLQIIVKLANIYLTPENNKYAGGSWHVEGQLNEHICASALFYYDSVNITESRLEFRQMANFYDIDDISYEQDHREWLKVVFGVEDEYCTAQEIGSVLCKEGRLITFLNTLQHRVRPFELEDPTKPGHRKILAMFLVDPNIRIISTANVPAQREDWWKEQVPLDRALGKLPMELFDEVVSHLDNFPMTMKEAKGLRLELMEERKTVISDHNNEFTSHGFGLCEH